MSYGYDHRIPLTLISNIIDKYLYVAIQIIGKYLLFINYSISIT